MLNTPSNVESYVPFSADTVPSPFCRRCESSGHPVTSCPFPDSAEVRSLAEKRRARRLNPEAFSLRGEWPEMPGGLPPYCGDSVECETYQRKARPGAAERKRKSLVAALIHHRLNAVRSAAIRNTLAASWHRAQADAYARHLGWKAQPSVMSAGGNPSEQIASWLRMSEVIEAESCYTVEDYVYG